MLIYIAHADLIKLDQTEIVGNLGENITVTGRVESCLASIYKVQLFCPNGTKPYSTNFIDCPTYNFSFPIKLNSSDNQCRLTIVNEHGKVQDSKSFNITGNQVFIIAIYLTLWYCNNTYPD